MTERVRANADHRPATGVSAEAALASIRDCAIVLLDRSGRVTGWNEGAVRLAGYAADEILGAHYARFFTEQDVHLGTPSANLERAVAHGYCSVEGFRIRKDGSRFWMHGSLTPIYDESGEVRGFAKVAADGTTLKWSESLLHSLVTTVVDGIITIDARGTVQSFNPAAEQMFGYSASEVVGQNVAMLMPQPYRDETMATCAGSSALG